MTRERIAGLPDDDWRKKHKRFKEPEVTKNLKLAALMGEIGAGRGRTAGEVAIAWTLEHPAVTGAIVGMRSPEQVDGVIHAAEIALSNEENRTIDELIGRPSRREES